MINTVTFLMIFFRQAGDGSNAWALSGKFTKSGGPILAADPHLKTSSPGGRKFIDILSMKALVLRL